MNNHIITNTYCKSCKKMILWTTNHRTGKKMPVDTELHPNGNVKVFFGDNGKHISLVGGDAHKNSIQNYWYTTKSHFATCPNAHNHRQKR